MNKIDVFFDEPGPGDRATRREAILDFGDNIHFHCQLLLGAVEANDRKRALKQLEEILGWAEAIKDNLR